MRSHRRHENGKGAIEIIEESLHLLRRAPLSTHASYYVGSLPFILGLLYFWADMSKSAFAYERLAKSAFVLTLLFIWMKMWQTVFARRLWAEIRGEAPAPWSFVRMLRISVRQTILQPSGLFLLPASLLMTVPFGWTYALYQNITVLDGGDKSDIRSLVRKASYMARLWQKQNHLLIWALSPYLLMVVAAFFLVFTPILTAVTMDMLGAFSALFFFMNILFVMFIILNPIGVVVAANIASAIFLFPQLFRMLTGAQIVHLSSSGTMLNSTFLAAVCGLTYVCMDPLVKAAYVLRCFYGESLRTGEDLRVELRRIVSLVRPAALLCSFGLGVFFARYAVAEQNEQPAREAVNLIVSPSELDQALDRELQGREYAWRMPRLKRTEAEDKEGLPSTFVRGALETMADWGEAILRRAAPVFRWLDKLMQWLRDMRGNEEAGGRSLTELSPALRLILYILVAGLLSVAAVMLWRVSRRRNVTTHEVIAEAAEAVPDIEDESTSADRLPEEDWLALARELIERGELRLALRAVFLATLAHLARRGLIQIARFKSNRDYKLELGRHAHAQSRALDIFSESVSLYEAVWYGAHGANRELLDLVIANSERLRTCE